MVPFHAASKAATHYSGRRTLQGIAHVHQVIKGPELPFLHTVCASAMTSSRNRTERSPGVRRSTRTPSNSSRST